MERRESKNLVCTVRCHNSWLNIHEFDSFLPGCQHGASPSYQISGGPCNRPKVKSLSRRPPLGRVSGLLLEAEPESDADRTRPGYVRQNVRATIRACDR